MSCFNDDSYLIFIIGLFHLLYWFLVSLRIKYAINHLHSLISFDISVALIAYVNSITNDAFFSEVPSELIGTIALAKVLNTALASATDVIGLAIFMLASTTVYNAITNGIDDMLYQIFSINTDATGAIIALVVVLLVVIVVYFLLRRYNVPSIIYYYLLLLLASCMCLPAMRILIIASSNINLVLYCCDSIETDLNAEFCPITFQSIYWLNLFAFIALGLMISYMRRNVSVYEEEEVKLKPVLKMKQKQTKYKRVQENGV